MSFENLSGRTLGQYQLRELLGIGGMGMVYRAWQPKLQREVAIKILLHNFAIQTGYSERFLREAQTAASLENPYIVPIHDYGQHAGYTFVVMRLLSGGSLADRLQQQADGNLRLPSLLETSEIIQQLASALDYAHSKRIIHRDIKASNVMFDDQGTAFLVDFGIAKLIDATSGLTTSNVIMGTPSYMSPEQWRGDEITPAADQYALGVMTYAMVTGHMPFEGNTPYALMHKHVNEQPPPPEIWRTDMPQGIKAALERAMAKNASDRFSTVSAFSTAFAQAIRGNEGQPTGFFKAELTTKPSLPNLPPLTNTPSISNTRTILNQLYGRPALMGIVVIIILLTIIALGLLSTSPRVVSPTSNVANSQVLPTESNPIIAILPTMTPSISPMPDLTTNTLSPNATDTAISTIEQIATAQSTITVIQTAIAITWTPTPTLSMTVANTVTPLVSPTAQSDSPSTIPQINQSQIAFRTDRDGNWEIYMMLLDGSNQINLTQNRADDQFPAWSPDGNQIAFVSNRDGNDEIYLMNSDGSNVHNLTNQRANDTLPSFSPDGKQIAFVAARKGNWEIYTMDADGSNARNLTNNASEDFTPSWSPDGHYLAFHSNRDGNFEIYVMEANGSNVRRVTNNGNDDFGPSWSPDGRKIAYYSKSDGDYEIYVMDVDGSNVLQLTSNSDDDVNPHWSPDGEKIIFSSRRDGNVEIYIMNADGTEQQRIQGSTDNDSSAAWQPTSGLGQEVKVVTSATPETSIVCPGTQPSQLVIGEYARVTPGKANRLRDKPLTSGKQIGQIPPGRILLVLDGPTCADNYAWWKVSHSGQIGWTAEGDRSTYWLEPIGASNQAGLVINNQPTIDEFDAAFQGFQHGYMLWLQPIGQIWVLIQSGDNKGTWTAYDDTWKAGEMESDSSLKPPGALLFQPVRGFGKVWRNTANLSNTLGWALFEEVAERTRYGYTPSDGVQVVTLKDGRFEFYNDGTWRRTS